MKYRADISLGSTNTTPSIVVPETAIRLFC